MTGYDILGDVVQLRDIFDNFFRGAQGSRASEYPLIDIYEGNDQIEIMGLVPGVKADDLSIQLVDNSLILEGVKKSDYVDSPYIRREREFGKFKRAVKLPYRVDPEKISAELKSGILVIRLAKSDDAKPKKIEVR